MTLIKGVAKLVLLGVYKSMKEEAISSLSKKLLDVPNKFERKLGVKNK